MAGNAGGRRVKIKVQSNPRPSDGHGGQDNVPGAWADKFEVWARMRQLNAKEVFANRQKNSRAMYRFEMDFPLGGKIVEETDRILVGTRAFDIRGVNNKDERNRVLIVTTEEGVPD